MQWCVTKTGFEMFDVLHAYGLGILLTTACGLTIELQEGMLAYRLSSQAQAAPVATVALLDMALPLPKTSDLDSLPGDWYEPEHHPLSVNVLDGLLTALFTIPGVRTLSVSDLVSSQQRGQENSTRSLAKVASAIAKWKTFASQGILHESNWLSDVLQDYTCPCPVLPLPVDATRKEDIRIPMTIDPSFGYSLRRPTSDGHLTHKTNLTVQGTRFATVLAFVGASRFLRAQRVAGKLVNVYVPLAATLALTQQTALPPLLYMDCPADEAATRQWLTLFSQQQRFQANWRGMAYQTMQTQVQQQSITIDRGYLDCTWLLHLTARTRQDIVNDWQAQLDPRGRGGQDARTHLTDTLIYHRIDRWMAHLRDRAYAATHPNNEQLRLYSVDEVRRLSAMMDASTNHPLRKILERQEGTLRFGHALRQLGRYKASLLRDVIELLETAQTLEQLIRALYRAMQECELAKAKYPFIIIPDNVDCAFLLDDVEQHGVRMIASLLMLLSVLRYPHTDEIVLREQPDVPEGDVADDTARVPFNSSEPIAFETLAFVEEGELNHDS